MPPANCSGGHYTLESHYQVETCCFFKGTFHSVGCRIVRRHVAHLGDTGRQAFNIFDQDDTRNVMKAALRQHFRQRKGDLTDDSMPLEDEPEKAIASRDRPKLPEWVRHPHFSLCI